MSVEFLCADAITATHGFFTRIGGASTGLYASLNCGLGSNDETSRVAENRARVASALGVKPQKLHTAYQVHSADAAIISADSDPVLRSEADALVSRDPGVALGMLTADCAPILFHDPVAGVIGAAHAGWKGALNNVTENTITAMQGLGAVRANISVAIGPCISQRAYETGPEFIDRFLADDSGNSRFFTQGSGDRLLFDLPGFVLHRLRRSGIERCDWTGHCTFSDPARFFSFRRTTHAGEPDYGRQISVIAL